MFYYPGRSPCLNGGATARNQARHPPHLRHVVRLSGVSETRVRPEVHTGRRERGGEVSHKVRRLRHMGRTPKGYQEAAHAEGAFQVQHGKSCEDHPGEIEPSRAERSADQRPPRRLQPGRDRDTTGNDRPAETQPGDIIGALPLRQDVSILRNLHQLWLEGGRGAGAGRCVPNCDGDLQVPLTQ